MGTEDEAKVFNLLIAVDRVSFDVTSTWDGSLEPSTHRSLVTRLMRP